MCYEMYSHRIGHSFVTPPRRPFDDSSIPFTPQVMSLRAQGQYPLYDYYDIGRDTKFTPPRLSVYSPDKLPTFIKEVMDLLQFYSCEWMLSDSVADVGSTTFGEMDFLDGFREGSLLNPIDLFDVGTVDLGKMQGARGVKISQLGSSRSSETHPRTYHGLGESVDETTSQGGVVKVKKEAPEDSPPHEMSGGRSEQGREERRVRFGASPFRSPDEGRAGPPAAPEQGDSAGEVRGVDENRTSPPQSIDSFGNDEEKAYSVVTRARARGRRERSTGRGRRREKRFGHL